MANNNPPLDFQQNSVEFVKDALRMKYLIAIILLGITACSPTPKKHAWYENVCPDVAQIDQKCKDYCYRRGNNGFRWTTLTTSSDCYKCECWADL